jgi:hypothetical protein
MNSSQAFNVADCARARVCLTFYSSDSRSDREATTYVLIDRLAHSILFAELEDLQLPSQHEALASLPD